MIRRLPLLLLACALLLPACGDDSGERQATESLPPPATGDTVEGEVSTGNPEVPVVHPSQTGNRTLVFDVPEGWKEEPASSSMRIAQASIPGVDGDGELAVFYFGPGGGGGVDANIDRWLGQVETTSEPERRTFEVGELTVTTLSAEGTLLPSSMGTGPASPQPDSMLLGGIVEGPGGPWFFKATGPATTLEPAEEDFVAMLETVRLEPEEV